MKITKKLYVTTPEEWRAWLQQNYQTAPDIWLVFPHKSTGEPRISYNDAVEQALCFGWIDSTVKKVDETHTAQRFSPRRNLDNFSLPNIERLRYMAQKGQLMPFVYEHVKPKLDKKFTFPRDIMQAIKKHPEAYKNFKKFSPAYQRIRVAYVDDARDRMPDEFKKRLNNLIEKSTANKQIGYGGIDKYY